VLEFSPCFALLCLGMLLASRAMFGVLRSEDCATMSRDAHETLMIGRDGGPTDPSSGHSDTAIAVPAARGRARRSMPSVPTSRVVADQIGREECRDVRKVENKPAAILHDMRRSSDDHSSGLPKLRDFHGELSRSGAMSTE
jgi:hypothetical protein